jgi:hydroxyacylglutathione hydrolase
VLARTFVRVLSRLDGGLEVHPGHDYAERNLGFVLSLEPGNEAARRRLDEVRAASARGEEPPPSTLAAERAVNPFLRTGEPSVRDAVARRAGTPVGGDAEAVFVALRALRDRG